MFRRLHERTRDDLETLEGAEMTRTQGDARTLRALTEIDDLATRVIEGERDR